MISAKKAKRTRDAFDPRGSDCPLCGKPFRYGCSHSVNQARERLDANVRSAELREEVARQLAEHVRRGVWKR